MVRSELINYFLKKKSNEFQMNRFWRVFNLFKYYPTDFKNTVVNYVESN